MVGRLNGVVRAGALAVVAFLAVVAASGCTTSNGTSAKTHRTPVGSFSPRPGSLPVYRGQVRRLIVLEAADRETLAPPLPGTRPALTATQAWTKLTRGRDKELPADVSAFLGLLTTPPSVTDVLVWGFTRGVDDCPAPIGGPGMTFPPTPPPCKAWDFIGAAAGSQEDSVLSQELPARHHLKPVAGSDGLRHGGWMDEGLQRYAPERLTLQAPESTIRWIFDRNRCTVTLHWFLPPGEVMTPAKHGCPWQHRFDIEVNRTMISRGRVFQVVSGYVVRREGQVVMATLGNGEREWYDESDSDGMWLFVVQRCGNLAGTAIEEVRLYGRHHSLMGTLRVPPPPPALPAASCS